ncbi:MAG: DUF1851 domain-containing protein [Chitinophagales bacterium]|nr:DUF1851 domain-containing protein [Chitinophagales bacterium]
MLLQLKNKYSHFQQKTDPYADFFNGPNINTIHNDELKKFLQTEGGTSFCDGLYRIHTLGSSYFWTSVIENCFPKYKNRVHCFSFDWLGRMYAKGLDNKLIYMFDEATAKAYELKTSLQDFHSVEIMNHPDEILNEDYFTNWLNEYGRTLSFDECVGFITPLFLGGEDQFNNYEIVDMEVNWETSFQIYNQIKGLPKNTIIDKVKLKRP